ncbi:MAG: YihY/virulence factor BrkB family protein [Gammaproteobacteria bacterium]|nr:YihY/virulence factor BrkB family protein [Gammaproteobacteria bacterium]
MITPRTRFVLENPWIFALRVINGFRANQGLLLSGAVAYYTLLSIVPMFALILVALSQVQEIQGLLVTLREYLVQIIPNQADELISQVSAFQQNWKVIGIMGALVLLFFSSFAFSSLESAMSVIFFHRVAIRRRRFFISAIIPYCYILLLALGMLIVSVVSGSLHTLDTRLVSVMGQQWSLSGIETILIYLLGIIGEVLLLTSIYLVMPVGRLVLCHALIGGITAALLWEITWHILVWYFTTLSLVNVVYGAFATVIIILLTLEAAAIILLLGAQVIAEYERIGSASTTVHGLQT